MSLIKYLTLIFCLILGLRTLAQTDTEVAGTWRTLAEVTYIKKYDEFLGFDIDYPVFSEGVKDLEGKEIVLSGYIIPVQGYKSHTEFIFSALPFNMCFFCGGAGPETVLEVKAKEPIKFTAESITIKGKLKLHADDIDRLMYEVEEAVKL